MRSSAVFELDLCSIRPDRWVTFFAGGLRDGARPLLLCPIFRSPGIVGDDSLLRIRDARELFDFGAEALGSLPDLEAGRDIVWQEEFHV